MEKSIIKEEDKFLQGSQYQYYCTNCGRIYYFNYKTKGYIVKGSKDYMSNPFNTLKCPSCGSKEGIIRERRFDSYE